MSKPYTVIYEQDRASGEWTASVARFQGISCTTRASTLAGAKKRIEEALAPYLDDIEVHSTAEPAIEQTYEASLESNETIVTAGMTLREPLPEPPVNRRRPPTH